MADKQSQAIDGMKVQAISLDDWVVTPVSLDDWVVESEIDATAETLVHSPEITIEKAEALQPVAFDDWIVEDAATSANLDATIDDEDLEGSIEIFESTFGEQDQFLQDQHQTQAMDVGLQGDLAELEETAMGELALESRSDYSRNEEDEDDLLSDFDDQGMHLSTDPFEPDEPVPSVSGLEFPPTSMQRVELDLESDSFAEAESEVKEQQEVECDELAEDPFEPDEPIPSIGSMEFPSASIQTVELDLETDANMEAAEPFSVEASEYFEAEDPIPELELSELTFEDEDDALGEPTSLELEHSDSDQSDQPVAAKAAHVLQDVELNAIHLEPIDLAELHWVKLSVADLAESHQLGVLRLTESDLRENSQLAVVRLHECDFADRHRKVIELDLNFFINHGIDRNAKGVILLKAEDLVDPSVLDEEEQNARIKPTTSTRKSKVKESKPSKFNDAMIIKYSALVIVFCLFALPLSFHFKYSWVTVSDKKYAEVKDNAGLIDWLYEGVFKYRTNDSFFRWYGRRKLTPKAYEAASKSGETMWLFYEKGDAPNQGDNWP